MNQGKSIKSEQVATKSSQKKKLYLKSSVTQDLTKSSSKNNTNATMTATKK